MSIRKALVPVFLGWLTVVAASDAAEAEAKVDVYGDPLPPGAISRLGTLRFRQHGELTGVTFSADGGTLHGFTHDTLLSWYAETGKLSYALPIDSHFVAHVAFSNDRRRAVTAGSIRLPDDTVHLLQVWDLEKLQPLESIFWQNESIPACVALSASGTMLAAGDYRGMVRIYDVQSQEEIAGSQLGERTVRSVAFSPVDEQLVVCLETERPLLWNWPDDEKPQALDEAYGWPRSVAWSHDGSLFAVARDWKDGVHIYDADSGQRIETLADEPGFSYVYELAFSPDGRLLATSDTGTRGVTLWNVKTREKIAAYKNRAKSRSLSFSPDGRWLADARGGYHARLRVLDVDTGQVLFGEAGHGEIPNIIEFLPGDEVVATAGDDGTLRFWDVESGRQLNMVAHRSADTEDEDATLWIRAMDVSPDGRLAATSSQDGTLRVWDVATAKEAFRLRGHGQVGGRRIVRFTPDGRHLVSVGDDFFLRIWSTETGKALAEHPLRPSGVNVPENKDGSMTIGPGAFSADAKQLILGMEESNNYYVFDVQSGQELARISAGQHVLHEMTLSPDGHHLLTADAGRRIHTKLVSGGERFEPAGDFCVQMLGVPRGEKVREWTIDGRIGGPVAFGPDGKMFAVAACEVGEPLRIYETEMGRLLAEIDGFNGYPWAIAFSNDGRLLATSLTCGSILIWDWKQFRQ